MEIILSHRSSHVNTSQAISMVQVSVPRSGHRSSPRGLPKQIKASGQNRPQGKGCHDYPSDNTERPETITIGTNELIGTDPGKLPPALARLMAGQWKQGAIPPLWDGRAKERIVAKLEEKLTCQ